MRHALLSLILFPIISCSFEIKTEICTWSLPGSDNPYRNLVSFRSIHISFCLWNLSLHHVSLPALRVSHYLLLPCLCTDYPSAWMAFTPSLAFKIPTNFPKSTSSRATLYKETSLIARTAWSIPLLWPCECLCISLLCNLKTSQIIPVLNYLPTRVWVLYMSIHLCYISGLYFWYSIHLFGIVSTQYSVE